MTKQLSSCLNLCNLHYENLNAMMEEIAERIKSDPPMVIREGLKKLEEMQEEASRLDRDLRARIDAEGMESIPEPDLIRRRNLLVRLAELNGLLVDRLEGKMSVMNHDMEVNRRSLRALNGYRSPAQTSGKVLQKST